MSDSDFISDPSETLNEIKSLMSRSGRFLSLSGLSGIWAGACALVAGVLAYNKANIDPFSGIDYSIAFYEANGDASAIEPFALGLGIVTMLVAVSGAAFFTYRRSQRTNYSLWNAASRSMLVSMLVPLAAGGLFVLAHWHHGIFGFSASITLIFYGLCLLAGGRYTLDEIRTLGYLEVALGVITAFFPAYGIDAWVIGFGLLHILYGAIMYRKYGA